MITIQPMTKEDIDMVAHLEKDTFSSPWSYENLQESLNRDNYYFLVAKEDSMVVGYIGMYAILDEGDITNIAVNKDFRRQGIGTMLLKERLWTAKKNNLVTVTLEVRVSNENAISLYKQQGFAIIGTRKKFYVKPEEDGYIMRYSHI